MKTSTMGIVLAAILMVVTSVGFAQAGGNQPYNPKLCYGDQDTNPCLHSYDPMLSYGDQDTNPFFMQKRGPVETGAIPEIVPEDCWMKEYGCD